MYLGSFAEALLSPFLPYSCVHCRRLLQRGEWDLCLECALDLPLTGFESDPNNAVAKVFWGRTPLERAWAFLHFNTGSVTESLVHHIKYKGRSRLAQRQGQAMARAMHAHPARIPDAIVPIPSTPLKVLKRGYNPSHEMALGMARPLDLPLYPKLLKRKGRWKGQTRMGRSSRLKNVRSLFLPGPMKGVPDYSAHLLILDDVITTGATIEAAAQTLKDMGYSRISVAALAYRP